MLGFLPLGGAGEIGMNLNLYQVDGAWLMVDCGVTFERLDVHRSQIAMADPAFIAARRDRLVGLVLTHAHLDHLGAVADLWEQLRCPVLATPFPAAILAHRLDEAGLRDQVPLRVVRPGSRTRLGPFDIEMVPITHSTVEASLVVIRTSHGTVVHTGDWKLDPAPQVGPPTDIRRLQEIGDEGVLALIGDSTNATRPGSTPSEGTVVDGLRELLAEREAAARREGRPLGRIVATCFASNVARVVTLARLADRLGRHPVLVGGSLHRVLEAARQAGYVEDLPKLVDLRDAGWLPPETVFLIATGSQGEPLSGLSRIARDRHPLVKLDPGDLVVFSSKRIPGNELAVDRLQQELRALGCLVLDDTHGHVHVSGHPAQDDLRTLYRWLRPRYVLPVHGEERHLRMHAELVDDLGLHAVPVRNGQLVRLSPEPVGVVEEVPAGRLRREDRGGVGA